MAVTDSGKKLSFPGQTIVHHKNPGSAIVDFGVVDLDGTNPTPVDCLANHGIKTILGAVVSLKGTGFSGADDVAMVSCDWTGSTLNIYAWEYNDGTAPAWAASTNSADDVTYVVFGTV